jgi:putative MATE family efflux protein
VTRSDSCLGQVFSRTRKDKTLCFLTSSSFYVKIIEQKLQQTTGETPMQYLIKRKVLIRSILLIAAPAIMEMALNTLLMVSDTLMVSRMIGTEALSAIGIVNSIFFLIIFVFSSFNTGAIAMISRSYGSHDMKKAEKVAGNNLSLNLIIGLCITLLAYLVSDWLFKPYDITANVLADAQAYFGIVIAGMVFQFGSFAFAAISRGVEDTRTPMYITAFANIFNIIFNYVLIKGVWIFPEMGIEGAALSTTLARFFAFFIYLYIFTSGRHRIKLTKPNLKPTKDVFQALWKISLPGAIEQLLMQGSFFVMGIIITLLDTTSEALFRILITIESTSFMPAVGISIATATLVGKAIGEKDIEKAADTGYLATGMGIVWGVIAGLAFFLFPRPLLSIFTTDLNLIESGRPVFYIMAINQIFLNAYIVMSGALRGAGDTHSVMRITSLRLWVVFVPLSYVMVKYLSLGVSSVWYAEILSFLIFLIFLLRKFHQKEWANIEL